MKSADYTALLRRREVVVASISGNHGNPEVQAKFREELKSIDERSRAHTKGEDDPGEAAAGAAKATRKRKVRK